MSGRLVPIADRGVPVINLQRLVLLVGRHPECDVRLDRASVSRRHCCLALAYERLLIRDLGSRNGVRVNGRKVEECRLMPGDEVAIAQVLYRFEAEPAQMPVSKSSGSAKAPAGEAPVPLFDMDEDLLPLEDD